MADDAVLGPTAAIITFGDEIVEGRVLNENASWLSEELMACGVWPRLVVAVPDVKDLIVRVLHIVGDRADLPFACGGLGFTPDDITCDAVAAAFFRDVRVDRDVARRFLRDNAWADERIAAAATFPINAQPLETATDGVPGFRLHDAYVLPGVPAEMRAMFPRPDAAGASGADSPDGDHSRHHRGPDRDDPRGVRVRAPRGPPRLLPGPGRGSPTGDARAGVALRAGSRAGRGVAAGPDGVPLTSTYRQFGRCGWAATST